MRNSAVKHCVFGEVLQHFDRSLGFEFDIRKFRVETFTGKLRSPIVGTAEQFSVNIFGEHFQEQTNVYAHKPQAHRTVSGNFSPSLQIFRSFL